MGTLSCFVFFPAVRRLCGCAPCLPSRDGTGPPPFCPDEGVFKSGIYVKSAINGWKCFTRYQIVMVALKGTDLTSGSVVTVQDNVDDLWCADVSDKGETRPT